MNEDTYPNLAKGVDFDSLLATLRNSVSEIVGLRATTTDLSTGRERLITVDEAIEWLAGELAVTAKGSVHYAASIVTWQKKNYPGESHVVTTLEAFAEAAASIFEQGLSQLRTGYHKPDDPQKC